MNSILRSAFGLGLTLLYGLAPPATAADPEQQSRELVGLEYVDVLQNQPFPGSECVSLGGGIIFIDGQEKAGWALDQAGCGRRTVYLLDRLVGQEGRAGRWRVVDAFLLPPIKKGVRLYRQGDCELDGRIDAEFFALVRLGKRDRVDYHTGVLGAWTVDLGAGKIVPLSTRRVVCYRPTPP